jgi:hypothetical protein
MADPNYYFIHNDQAEAKNNVNFKVKPKPFNNCGFSILGDLRNFAEKCNSAYDFKIISKSTHLLCLLKSSEVLKEVLLVGVDENIVTISQFSVENIQNSLEGFSHSFVIPFHTELNSFEVYAEGQFLAIIIPKY